MWPAELHTAASRGKSPLHCICSLCPGKTLLILKPDSTYYLKHRPGFLIITSFLGNWNEEWVGYEVLWSVDYKRLVSIKAALRPHLFVLSGKSPRFQPAGRSKKSVRISLSCWFLPWEEQPRVVNSISSNTESTEISRLVLAVCHMKHYFQYRIEILGND